MSQEEKKMPKKSQPRRRHRSPAAPKTPPVEIIAPKTNAIEESGFITKEDLSRFLSIKPYLSDKAQSIVDMLSEVHRTGGKIDQASIFRLLGLFGLGQSNLGPLASLAGMASSGGKMDPGALATMMSTMFSQMNNKKPE